MLTVKILNITQIIEYFNVWFSGEQWSWSRVSAYCGLLTSENSFFKKIFIFLATPGLSHGMRDLAP